MNDNVFSLSSLGSPEGRGPLSRAKAAPPNQLVYVRVENSQRVPVSFWNPVWSHGTLTVEKTTNPYGSVSFKMAGTSIAPYEW